MRLEELNPEIIDKGDDRWVMYHNCVKHGSSCWGEVYFSRHREGMPYWKLVGEDSKEVSVKDLTLSPSIRSKGCYHINITNGEVIDHKDE